MDDMTTADTEALRGLFDELSLAAPHLADLIAARLDDKNAPISEYLAKHNATEQAIALNAAADDFEQNLEADFEANMLRERATQIVNEVRSRNNFDAEDAIEARVMLNNFDRRMLREILHQHWGATERGDGPNPQSWMRLVGVIENIAATHVTATSDMKLLGDVAAARIETERAKDRAYEAFEKARLAERGRAEAWLFGWFDGREDAAKPINERTPNPYKDNDR